MLLDQTLSSLVDMLEMYFEETSSKPDNIIMIAADQAAIVSFTDPEGLYFNYTYVKVMESQHSKQWVR